MLLAVFRATDGGLPNTTLLLSVYQRQHEDILNNWRESCTNQIDRYVVQLRSLAETWSIITRRAEEEGTEDRTSESQRTGLQNRQTNGQKTRSLTLSLVLPAFQEEFGESHLQARREERFV
jgi:hypothetical protein